MAWPGIQSRGLLAGLLMSLALLSWWALWIGQRGPWGHYALHAGHAPAGIFIAGWTLMTIAMMLPTSTPLILMFHRMMRGRAHGRGLVALLIAGYLAIWLLAGAAAYLLVRALSGLVSGPLAGAAILAGAGVYQFSRLKYACLDKCRSPMAFLVEHWKGNAFRLGVAHGIYCVGCCWSLMLLMFVAGMGSVLWMLGLGMVMAAEKNLPWGRRLSAPLGVTLVAGAVAMAVMAMR